VSRKPLVDFAELEGAAARCALPVVRGRITAVEELSLAALLPGARIGTRVEVVRPGIEPVAAEVVVCDGERVRLAPFDSTAGIGPGDRVVTVPGGRSIPCGPGLLGRVIDPAGRPLDGRGPLADVDPWPLDRLAPDPLNRLPVDRQLVTGVRAIDGCVALGLGQRLGLFAGPGLGKTTLLGVLARRARCDAAVICLVGERGREVRDFVDHILGAEGLARTCVVLAAADAPALVRVHALSAATAVAEWFRDQGAHALLLVDSLTRVVRARRDVALSLGERPARGGFPASAFAAMPGLLERAGCAEQGSITGVYAVLTEGGADDPVAEEARSLLDGHLVLDPGLARAGRWPAIDVLESVSRVMGSVVPEEQAAHAAALRRLVGAYRENEDLILMGAYRRGTSRDTDAALDRKQAIDDFLAQDAGRPSSPEQTRAALADLVRGA
jgi:type III secretion protein N (ATPase)